MILKKGTVKCPKCKTALSFEQIQGMRIYRGNTYSCRCDKCNIYYSVER